MTASYLELNAELNILSPEGEFQTDKDREAARQYFLQHVNRNYVFFHDIHEKVDYMVENGYWDGSIFESYSDQEIKSYFQHAYSYKFRFDSFVSAYKFYTSYALKTFDGERFLERYEDRVVMVALDLANPSNKSEVERYISLMMEGLYQPATPTFLNAGRKDSGEQVSCFLLRIEDNMESIGRAINSSLQLSKRGGGVALLLSNLREQGAPIKKVQNQSSGVIPVMKLLEDSFSYANQLGVRQGAGAVYLNAHHPDILSFLDTKRENADEKIRIKTLSLGVVVPDITFELAREDKDMYLFSPYDVERVHGTPFADLSVTEYYDEWVANPEITKSKINARKLFQTIAEIQFESGYPYLVFEDTVNEANPISGRINMSNLCSEILQVNSPSLYYDDLNYRHIGNDISCNLGSFNIANVMDSPRRLLDTVGSAVDMLTAVTVDTSITSVPSIVKGNESSRAIGLGQMNLHGYLAQNKIKYGSPESLEFVDVYFAAVRFFALWRSMELARDYEDPFTGFYDSGYADGTTLQEYLEIPHLPVSDTVKELFGDRDLPTPGDWKNLDFMIRKYGLYHAYMLAVPPTGNISYVNNSTASIHPVTSPVEIRKEGKMGRVYYPAPGLSSETLPYYEDAYDIGYKKIIDVYAAATKHTDQGLSLTLFFKSDQTTRDLNKAYIYAWRKGIKTIYYSRVRQISAPAIECATCVL